MLLLSHASLVSAQEPLKYNVQLDYPALDGDPVKQIAETYLSSALGKTRQHIR